MRSGNTVRPIANSLGDGETNFVNGQDQVCGTRLRGGPGHPVNDAGGLVLGDGEPTRLSEGQQALSPIASHPGQDGRGSRLGPVLKQACQEHIN